MTSSRTDAQRRADEIRIFRRELERLQRENVVQIPDTQLQSVTDHHDRLLAQYAQAFDIDHDAYSKQLSLGMRIASFLGALALAASMVFLFYQFWGSFSSSAQVGILVTASLGTLVATMWTQSRDGAGYFTKIVAMLAFVSFVLNIGMLGQIFNITPSDKALLPWAALAFLLAYTCDLRLLLAAGILCVVAFLSARTGTWGGLYWLDFGERPENFLPAAALIFAVPLVIKQDRWTGFATIYRTFALLTFFLPILALSEWGDGSYLTLDRDLIEGFYQVLGFVTSGAVIWLGIRRGWSDVVNSGMIFFVVFLYTKFYDWWWDVMPKYLFFFVIGLTAILFLVILRRLRGHVVSEEGER